MDFSRVVVPQGQPSDIDMVYVDRRSGFMFLGEIKNVAFDEIKWGQSFQKTMLQSIVDGYKPGGMLLLLLHDNRWQRGDEKVDVQGCLVYSYYYKGEWHQPSERVTVSEAIIKTLRHEYQENANCAVSDG